MTLTETLTKSESAGMENNVFSVKEVRGLVDEVERLRAESSKDRLQALTLRPCRHRNEWYGEIDCKEQKCGCGRIFKYAYQSWSWPFGAKVVDDAEKVLTRIAALEKQLAERDALLDEAIAQLNWAAAGGDVCPKMIEKLEQERNSNE